MVFDWLTDLSGSDSAISNQTRNEYLTAFFAGVAGVAGSYAASAGSSSFVGSPLGYLVVILTPGEIIGFFIDNFGGMGVMFAFGVALLIGVFIYALIVLASLRMGEKDALPVPVIAAVVVWVVTTFLTLSPLVSIGASVPVALVVKFSRYTEREDERGEIWASRRWFFRLFIGSFGFAAGSYYLGRFFAARRNPPEIDLTNVEDEVESMFSEANEKSFGLDGSPDMISQNFYVVDKNTVSPSPSVEDWELSVTGKVENEFTLNYDDVLSMEPQNRFFTLRCVGDSLNGRKMDNAVWTGIPISRLFERANPQGDYVMLRAVDNFYEGFAIDAIRPGFLAYAMNGEVLPYRHGYPLRALIPGHWGELNVKWLNEIEVLEKEKKGYWEKKGWHGTGPVNTVAKIWSESSIQEGYRVGGYAYAGTRGISKVEVSLDGGDTWRKAELSEPLDAEDAWRQWKYEWEPSKKKYEVVVRATDGKGDIQPREFHQPYPSGATGWVSKTIKP